jgi:hypothetical protein
VFEMFFIPLSERYSASLPSRNFTFKAKSRNPCFHF